MILYLSSSPCVVDADRALINPDNGFLDSLKKDLPVRPRCLYIASSPDASDKNLRYSADMAGAFREAGMAFGELKILERVNMDSAQALIRWSEFIILAGGHVPTQNAFFREVNLEKLLAGYPGVIIGISAGTMNCAAMVYAQPECPGESLDPEYRRFLPGLGLTYLNILPHYQQVKDDILDGQRLFEDITYPDSYGHRFLVLPDGSYVRVSEGQSVLHGEAYLLEDSMMWKICRNHESIKL